MNSFFFFFWPAVKSSISLIFLQLQSGINISSGCKCARVSAASAVATTRKVFFFLLKSKTKTKRRTNWFKWKSLRKWTENKNSQFMRCAYKIDFVQADASSHSKSIGQTSQRDYRTKRQTDDLGSFYFSVSSANYFWFCCWTSSDCCCILWRPSVILLRANVSTKKKKTIIINNPSNNH